MTRAGESTAASTSLLSRLSTDEDFVRRALSDRTGLLACLRRDHGIVNLGERQQLANQLARVARERAQTAVPTEIPDAVRSEAGPPPQLTICGKRDGFGAQLLAQMSGVALCLAEGRSYVHSPMSQVEHLEASGLAACDMDAFGGMGQRSATVDELSTLERGRLQERPFCEEVARSPDSYFTEGARALLRRKYASGPSNVPQIADRLPTCLRGAADRPVIALHVRRGDVTPTQHARRWVHDERYTALLPLLAARHPSARVLVVSEGEADHFAALLDEVQRHFASSAELLLGGDPRVAFHALVRADALVCGRSAFSYAAGLLSPGAVYADLVRGGVWGWHRVPSAWLHLIAPRSHAAGAAHVAAKKAATDAGLAAGLAASSTDGAQTPVWAHQLL